jgi:hypothetical protein
VKSSSQTKQSSAQPPIPDYDFDLSGQMLHDEPTLSIDIEDGILNFLPNADVAINYNKYRGVTYLKALLDTDSLKLNLTTHMFGQSHTGNFPANEAERMFYEKKYTSLTFNMSTRQNGVPVVVAGRYDIYLGTEGSGTVNGDTSADMESVYTDLLLGGIYTPGVGVENFNESTPTFNNLGVPTLPRTGGDFSWRVYVRPEVHMKLYGNPVPGSSEDLDLRAIPYLSLSGLRTTAPANGYNFTQSCGMDSHYKMQLFHIGSVDTQSADLLGVPAAVRGGFEPDGGVVRRTLSGGISDGAGAVVGVRVDVTDSTSGDLIGSDFTDGDGVFVVAGILDGTSVAVTPISGTHTFSPPTNTVVMDADQFVNFTQD